MEYSKAQLRSSILDKRLQLSSNELLEAAVAVAGQVQSTPALTQLLNQAKNILSYTAFKGEVSPHILLENQQALVFWPKIIDYDNGQMAFYPANQIHIKNRFGINEPRGDGSPTPITKFDIVFAPLVAFDQHGNRLGMGAGFYDRSFQALKEAVKKPILIGLAHSFQEVKEITADSWDHPLDVILTGEKIIDPAGILQDKH